LSNPRIIGGKARGIRLLPVPGDSTRPITDRVKEALFNILGQDVDHSTWLDLFGGTGSVGIEALSRGAAFARLIDTNRNAISTIHTNLSNTHLGTNAEVLQVDAFNYLKRSSDRQFEYIYIAPPQYKEMWVRAIRLLDDNPSWLAPDGWIIVQIHPVEYIPLDLENFVEFDQRKYGSTLLVFFDRKQG